MNNGDDFLLAVVVFVIMAMITLFLIPIVGNSAAQEAREQLSKQIAEGEVIIEKHTFSNGETEYRIIGVTP